MPTLPKQMHLFIGTRAKSGIPKFRDSSKARGCHPYLRNVSAFSVNFHLNRWRYSHVTSFLANHAAMFLGPWACGSECCSSNINAPDTSQKGLISIQSHHSREKMSKKAREKPAEAGSASVSPYGSVLSYELVTSQPNRLINLIWPECRTWFIGPWSKAFGIHQSSWHLWSHDVTVATASRL